VNRRVFVAALIVIAGAAVGGVVRYSSGELGWMAQYAVVGGAAALLVVAFAALAFDRGASE